MQNILRPKLIAISPKGNNAVPEPPQMLEVPSKEELEPEVPIEKPRRQRRSRKPVVKAVVADIKTEEKTEEGGVDGNAE